MDERPLDVDQLMDELRRRVSVSDARMPLFVPPDDLMDGRITLRDVTPESPRPVIGRGVTKAKRTAVRSVWPVLHDLVEQVNAALLEFDYVEGRIDGLEVLVSQLDAAAASIASVRTTLADLQGRLTRLEDLALTDRIARLEAASAPAPPLERVAEAPPIDPDLASLALTLSRANDLGDDRLIAYRAAMDPSAPGLDLSWNDEEQGDPLGRLAAAQPESVGGIMALGLGDHLTRDQWLSFASMAAAALIPGGGLVLEMVNSTTPAAAALRSRDPSLAPAMHPETTEFLLRAAGFSDVEVRYFGEFPDDARAPIVDDPDWFDARLNRMATIVNRLVVGQPFVAIIARR